MTEGIGSQAARGAIFSGGSQLVKVILSIVATVILARILSPVDFGIIAMIVPVTAFAELVQNFGLYQALVQAKKLERSQISAAFWVNTALALTTALLIVAVSPLIGFYYSSPEAGAVAAATASVIFFTGLAQTHLAILARDLKFGKIAMVEVISALALFATTLFAAWWLENYWAIFLGTLVAAILNVGLVWAISDWMPGLSNNWRSVRSLFGLAGAVTGFNVLGFIARQSDNLIIGAIEGPASLGLYDRAYRLMTFPIATVTAPLGRVMLPVLSRLADEPVRFSQAFLRSIWVMLLLIAPAAAAAAVFSEVVIQILLGSGWQAAAPIFFWLSIAGIYQSVSSATGWLFISLDRRKTMLRWGVFSTFTTVLSFVVGIQWGVEGLAMAYVLTSIARLPILYHISTNGTQIQARSIYLAFAPIAACVLVALIAKYFFADTLGGGSLLAIGVTISYLSAFSVAWLIPAGREAILSSLFHGMEQLRGLRRAS